MQDTICAHCGETLTVDTNGFSNDNLASLSVWFTCSGCGEQGSASFNQPVEVEYDRDPDEDEDDC